MTGRPFIVGLTGFKRSGKNAVGDLFAELLPGETVQVAFADPLKEYALALNPMIEWSDRDDAPIYLADEVERLGWEETKDLYAEARKTLQRLGTEVFRKHVHENHWIDLMYTRIGGLVFDEQKNVVVTDCRFQNELDLVTVFHNSHTFRVERDSVAPDLHSAHVSETGIPTLDVHAVIDNNGTLDDLRAQVSRWVSLIG